MGWHVLLPGLLLSLPLVTGWTTSKCLLTEDSPLPLVSRYFSLCSVSVTQLSFLAACISVTNLTQTLAAVPQTVEGLCLSGSMSSLPPDAFSAFPRLKMLGLNLHLTRLLPGALRGLGQLQKLSFLDHPFGKKSLFIPPDAFGDLVSLQRLHISGPCLDKKAGIQLPRSLQRLAVMFNCLQDVGELAGMFPDLVQGSSRRDPWTLRMLDLSFNRELKMASPGSLQGLQLETLNLDQTLLEASRVRALGLQKLDVLSAKLTATAQLPAEAVAHLELQELNVGYNKIGSISQEALASCHSLKTLGLESTGLTKLPPGFLAAMPRLQRLNLAGNQLQSDTLCLNETGDVSGLMTLNLADNGLRTLPPATFSCLPHLRELLLQDNQLLSLERQLLQGLQQLETLNLDKNPLLNLGKNWLAALPALTALSLLDTHLSLIPDPGFWGAKSLRTLRLKLPSVPAPTVLSLPMYLTSLELHEASGRKPWGLSPNVFPFLETLTIKGKGLKLEGQNASEVFPALQQLSLLQNSLEAFCSRDNSNTFPWQLPKLQTLKIWGAGSNFRPCLITGLPSLQELKLEALQSTIQPRSVQLEELVGELPQLQALQLSDTGLKSLSATAFQRLSSLRVLVVDSEEDLVLHDSLGEYSPQMPQYIYILQSNLACQCANAWMEPWVKQSTKTYIYIHSSKLCPAEEGVPAKHSLFSFLWDHCPQSLELKLFLASSSLVFLLIALPLLQEAGNLRIPFLQALFRVWLQGRRGQRDEGKRFLFDVFVSHCRQDQGWVIEELLPALEGPGLRLCLPDRDFEPGKDVVENVADSMVSSRVILCVLSGQALCNPRCRLELRLATSLFLAAPFPPVLLLAFLEPISRHQLPGYHRLARLLRRGDYCLWPEEDERKAGFWAWLRSRLGQPGVE
ncbi:toll-like receptor 12 [Mesocricetus auratus]|uniref:Toll-like receptor 12 n=1 Tax=Mesocricetus auratus TaxID=10036 RepID=A0A1U7R2G7_MESAU|nr:toll-like receptor 12 [Mesocricetus auratus]